MTEGNCPEPDTLRQLLVGEVSGLTLEQMYRHIDGCPNCQSRVQAFENARSLKDPISDALAGITPTVLTQTVDPQSARLLERVKRSLPFLSESCSLNRSVQKLPTTVGQYDLLNEVGQGGMGTVYEARHRSLGRKVAFKDLGNHFNASTEHLTQVSGEWLAHGKLTHPNIVQATDAGVVDGIAYLVTELIDGCDLQQLISRSGPLSIGQAGELIRQACEGLWHAHRQGVLHHDVKPSNLMIDQAGCVKLLDLGIADVSLTASDLEHQLDEKNVNRKFRGTIGFVAPERLNSDSGWLGDPRSDQYSLGATLYYMLEGQAPLVDQFQGNRQALMKAHHSAEPSPLIFSRDHQNQRAVAEIRQLVSKMLSKHPVERYDDLGQVLDIVRRLADSKSIQPLLAVVSQCAADRGRDNQKSSAVVQFPLDDSRFRVSTRPGGSHKPSRSWLVPPLTVGSLLLVGMVALTAAWLLLIPRYTRPSQALESQLAMEQLSSVDESAVSPADNTGPGLLTGKSTLPDVWVANGPRGAVTSLAWSPDGLRLAVYSGDMFLRVYRFEDDQLVFEYPVWFPYPSGASVRWNSTGTQLAMAGECSTASRLVIVHANSGKLDSAIDVPDDSLTGFDWLADSGRLVIAFRDSLRVWDSLSQQFIAKIPGYSPNVICSIPSESVMGKSTDASSSIDAGSTDSKTEDHTPMLLVGFSDQNRGRIIIGQFNSQSDYTFQELMQVPFPPIGQPVAITADPSGSRVACAFTRSVEVVSLSGETVTRAVPRGTSIFSVSWLAGLDNQLALGFLGGWKAATLTESRSWRTGETHYTASALYSEYQVAAHPLSGRLAVGTHGKVVVFDDSGNQLSAVALGGTIVDATAHSCGYAFCDQEGSILFTDEQGNHLHILESVSGLSADGVSLSRDCSRIAVTYAEKPWPNTFETNLGSVSRADRKLKISSAIAFGSSQYMNEPEGNDLLVIGSRYGRTTKILHRRPLSSDWETRTTRVSNPRLLAIDPQGQRLAVASYRQEIEAQSLLDGTPLFHVPPLGTGTLRDITWTGDGRKLIIACDRDKYLELVALDSNDGSILWRQRRSHRAHPRLGMQGLLDDHLLLCSVGDSLIAYDISTGDERRRLTLPTPMLADMRVTTRPQADTFVTVTHANHSGTAIIWDKASWAPQAVVLTTGLNQWVTLTAEGQIINSSGSESLDMTQISFDSTVTN